MSQHIPNSIVPRLLDHDMGSRCCLCVVAHLDWDLCVAGVGPYWTHLAPFSGGVEGTGTTAL